MGQEAELGQQIGGYVLERVLGVGGMGRVYLGRHALLGRKAAVKVLDPRLAEDKEFISRFFHEAKIVNDVRHPNIVDIIDFIQLQNPTRVAYVMEYLEGAPLNVALQENRFTPWQVLHIGRQIAEALAAVHALGVVHRDLKPGNVLFARKFSPTDAKPLSVKLLDFGIAKIVDPMVQHHTTTGAVLGTPAYMAPEQVAGDPITTAADVYAWGEIFYEALTGVRVFTGANVEIMRAKLAVSAPRLKVPAGLENTAPLVELAQSCISSAPDRRPSIRDVLATLTRIDESWSGIETPMPNAVAGAKRLVAPAVPTALLQAPPTGAGREAELNPPTNLQTAVLLSATRSRRGPLLVVAALLMVGAAAVVIAARQMGGDAGTVKAAVETHEPPPVDRVLPPPEPTPTPAPAPEIEPALATTGPKGKAKGRKVQGTTKLTIEVWTTAGRQIPAQVTIDREAIGGRTPLTVATRTGTRKVTVTAPGYPAKTESVRLEGGSKPRVLQIVIDLE